MNHFDEIEIDQAEREIYRLENENDELKALNRELTRKLSVACGSGWMGISTNEGTRTTTKGK